MPALLLLILLFPFIELALLIKVGGLIGVLPTLLLVLAGIILGGLLLRVAGLATAWRARERLARGELPEQEMLEGLCIALGGGLLVLPGFISDALGLLCLLPFTRRLLLRRLFGRLQRGGRDGLGGYRTPGAARGQEQTNVIEGEFERRDQ